jgi:hypothetical protein
MSYSPDLKPATAHTLHERLIQSHAMEPGESFNEDTARSACAAISQVMCARINGRGATFGQYFAQVFGRTIDGKAVKIPKPKAAQTAAPVS